MLFRSDKQLAEQAEKTRMECLDKLCPGDVEPKRDMAAAVALKLNGQWYLGPKEYFSTGIHGASFMWWAHKPLSSQMKLPPEVQVLASAGKADEVSVVMFLRSHDGIMHGPSRPSHLQQAEAEGRLISKDRPRPGLEVWRVRETDGFGPAVWYVATAYRDGDPNGAVLSCRDNNPQFDICTTAFIWRPGISADMRFRAKHALDWPEIYQETNRVLQLLKKA